MNTPSQPDRIWGHAACSLPAPSHTARIEDANTVYFSVTGPVALNQHSEPTDSDSEQIQNQQF